MELNAYEKSWSKSHRSMALDAAKERRGNQLGGYLSVWPEDVEPELQETTRAENAVSANVDGEEKRSRKRRKTTVPVRNAKRSNAARTDPAVSAPGERSASGKSSAPGERSGDLPERAILEGTNERKVNILFEGGGDYSGKGSLPERQPVFLENITVDQQDLLALQVHEFEAGKRTLMTQTTKVEVMENEKDVEALIVKEGVEKGVQCDHMCLCKEKSVKIDLLIEMVSTLKESMENKLENSLIFVDLLESLALPGTREQLEGGASTSGILKESNVEVVQVKNVVNIEDVVNAKCNILKDNVQTQESNDPEDKILFVMGNSRVFIDPEDNDEEVFTANILPSLSSLISSPLIHTDELNYFSRPCSSGGIIEIASHQDLPARDCEVRIHPEVQRKVKEVSCSVGIVWIMAKILFTTEELHGKNYSRRKGKDCLSPRRVHALEHACMDTFGPGNNIKLLSNAVNSGIRNLNRQPLKKLFDN